MKRNFIIASLCILSCIFFSGCFRHSCVGQWKGTLQRDELTDIYKYDIHPNGTVDMTHVIPQTDYELHYSGKWKEVNSDVIYMELQSDVHTSSSSYSIKDRYDAISKEKTWYGKQQADKRTSGLRSTTGVTVSNGYLRKDGHTANWDQDFDNPRCVVLSKD